MNKNKLHGIIPYLISPIKEETGEVNTEVLYNLSKDLIKKGVHGLSPLGSAGEVHYLNWEQKTTIVRTVIDAADDDVPVVAGVAAFTPAEAIEQIHYYEKLGVYGVVLNLNTYFQLTSKEIVSFIRTIANSVTSDIVLYNNPKFSKVDLTPEIVIELSKEPNINYFKDATGETGRLLTIMNRTSDIHIFSASAHIPLTVMQLGGVGWMAGPACVFPEESVHLYQLASSKNWEAGLETQKCLWQINEIFKQYTPARSMKASLEALGYDVGNPLSPLDSIKETDKQSISDALVNIQSKFKKKTM